MRHGLMLGAWARKRRQELGLTQEQVAERMGPDAPDNFVTKLENGSWKGLIPQPRLGQLVRALNATEVEALAAAGVITEAPAGGGRCPLFPEDDPRFAIAAELRDLDDGELVAVRALIAGLRGHRRFRQRPAPDPVGAGVDG